MASGRGDALPIHLPRRIAWGHAVRNKVSQNPQCLSHRDGVAVRELINLTVLEDEPTARPHSRWVNRVLPRVPVAVL